MPGRPRIALCLEYPLGLRGGVSVIVEEVIAGLSDEFEFILASPDDPHELAAHPVSSRLVAHLPLSFDALSTNDLPARLRESGVHLAHFHAGGAYGWGNCWPVASLPERCSREGIACLWTDHLVIDAFNGYLGGARPLPIRMAAFPFAWAGKLRQMRAVACEVAVSQHDRAVLATRYFPLSSRLRRIYHSRLDESEAPSSERRREEILNVGHIAFRKGQHILAAAFASVAVEFPDWSLVLAGHDAGDGCWQEIERIAAAAHLEDRIRMPGAVDHVAFLQRAAAIYVQPSIHEALGLALQEAIFRGCPSIGTRAGGIPEVIEEGVTGLLVPPSDVAALAAALKQLITQPELREKFSSAGRASIVAKKMTRQGMLDSHRALYREFVAA
jgi:glycosyltransferase involved in cell wall biosynthesis